MKRLILVLFFALCLAVTAMASDTVYISSREGDDSFNGSISAPLKTLKAAIEAVSNGGKIVSALYINNVMCDTDITLDSPAYIDASSNRT